MTFLIDPPWRQVYNLYPSSNVSSEDANRSALTLTSDVPHVTWTKLFAVVFSAMLLTQGVAGCAPGRRSMRRRSLKHLTPLILHQRVPDVPERSDMASGAYQTIVTRRDKKPFNKLVKNNNPDINFKDEERTGSDRLMTPRCRDRVDQLAMLVMLQWKGVKLRILEAWDENMRHGRLSHHYEGRAVDLTTSDRDRSKYGLLASLAVEAGFDWVYYESRGHIHASVKSDEYAGARIGCFPSLSSLTLSDGRAIVMKNLQIGDKIHTVSHEQFALSSQNSHATARFSEITMFLHIDDTISTRFVEITTQTGQSISLTPEHLMPVRCRRYCLDNLSDEVVYKKAADVAVTDLVLAYSSKSNTTDDDKFCPSTIASVPNENLDWVPVSSLRYVLKRGVYAPVTREGYLIVDGVIASCYALIASHTTAHWSIQSFSKVADFWGGFHRQSGIHWYADFLHNFAEFTGILKFL